MAIYTAAGRTSASTAVAALELRTAATDRIYIKEMGFFVAGVAGAYNFGIGRPTAIGVTPTANTAIVPLPLDSGAPATTAVMAIAWGTAPTAPVNAVYMRRINLPATLGAGVIWTFQDPLIVPVSSSLAVFLLSAPTASSFLDYYIVFDD